MIWHRARPLTNQSSSRPSTRKRVCQRFSHSFQDRALRALVTMTRLQVLSKNMGHLIWPLVVSLSQDSRAVRSASSKATTPQRSNKCANIENKPLPSIKIVAPLVITFYNMAKNSVRTSKDLHRVSKLLSSIGIISHSKPSSRIHKVRPISSQVTPSNPQVSNMLIISKLGHLQRWLTFGRKCQIIMVAPHLLSQIWWTSQAINKFRSAPNKIISWI